MVHIQRVSVFDTLDVTFQHVMRNQTQIAKRHPY